MMRNAQKRAHRKAMKRALIDENRGLFSVIQKFNRFHLGLIVFALSTSVILLFVGTYAYFNAHITKPTNESLSRYTSILHWLNIDTNDFDILSKSGGNTNTSKQNRVALSVMFVASVSILFEIGLLCAALFEHSKLGLYTVALMCASFVHQFYFRTRLRSNHQLEDRISISCLFQLLIFASSCLFLLVIKVKSYAASRMLPTRCRDMELLTNTQKASA